MRRFLAAVIVFGLGVSAAGDDAQGRSCAALKGAFPDLLFFPEDAVYRYEVTQFWSNTELMSPGCVFRPTAPTHVSAAVLASQKTEGAFAVRGGGHMGIKGSNNIDNGVLMVMSNLSAIALSPDQATVTIGPGLRWGAVYAFLEPHGLGVAGGRLAPVGVPGLLLGGGINFYGNQHGWSADNVVEYEVVLADGRIVNASATSEPELFWALKGGSNNFGIVTSFKMKTYNSPQVWAGVYTVGGEHVDEFLAAVANYSAFNTDSLSHIVPMVIPVDPNTTLASVILFYDSPTVSNPQCFAQFLAIPSVSSSLNFKTLSAFAAETGGLVVDHINDIFFAGTTVGKDYDSLLKGVQITNDVFFGRLPDLYAEVPSQNLSLVSIDWQPIGTLWQEGSKRENPNGNPLGVDPASKGTYLAWAGVVEWIGSDFDAAVNKWVISTTAAINDATKAAGIFDEFNYMGDSAGFQDVYQGYGPANEDKLLEISRQYDPDRVFQKLLPGGFKIDLDIGNTFLCAMDAALPMQYMYSSLTRP